MDVSADVHDDTIVTEHPLAYYELEPEWNKLHLTALRAQGLPGTPTAAAYILTQEAAASFIPRGMLQGTQLLSIQTRVLTLRKLSFPILYTQPPWTYNQLSTG